MTQGFNPSALLSILDPLKDISKSRQREILNILSKIAEGAVEILFIMFDKDVIAYILDLIENVKIKDDDEIDKNVV